MLPSVARDIDQREHAQPKRKDALPPITTQSRVHNDLDLTWNPEHVTQLQGVGRSPLPLSVQHPSLTLSDIDRKIRLLFGAATFFSHGDPAASALTNEIAKCAECSIRVRAEGTFDRKHAERSEFVQETL